MTIGDENGYSKCRESHIPMSQTTGHLPPRRRTHGLHDMRDCAAKIPGMAVRDSYSVKHNFIHSF